MKKTKFILKEEEIQISSLKMTQIMSQETTTWVPKTEQRPKVENPIKVDKLLDHE